MDVQPLVQVMEHRSFFSSRVRTARRSRPSVRVLNTPQPSSATLLSQLVGYHPNRRGEYPPEGGPICRRYAEPLAGDVVK